jgi:hypothetical protein
MACQPAARRQRGRESQSRGLPLEELIAEGNLGLLRGRGRQGRVAPRLPLQHLRHLVDPPGHRASYCRQGPRHSSVLHVSEALAQWSRAMGQLTSILDGHAQHAGLALAGSADGEGRRIPSLSHVRLMEIPCYGARVKVKNGTPPRYPTSRPRVRGETDRRATVRRIGLPCPGIHQPTFRIQGG